jgi:entericidin B
MKRRHLTTIFVLAGALMAAACANTIKGVGQDAANTVNATENAGKKIVNAAQ